MWHVSGLEVQEAQHHLSWCYKQKNNPLWKHYIIVVLKCLASYPVQLLNPVLGVLAFHQGFCLRPLMHFFFNIFVCKFCVIITNKDYIKKQQNKKKTTFNKIIYAYFPLSLLQLLSSYVFSFGNMLRNSPIKPFLN